MTENSSAKLSALERKKDISEIAGLSIVDGRIQDDRAERDTGFRKYHEQIFRDQLIANTRLLQYYHKLSSKDATAFSMQKSALEALHRIYSLKLRPAKLTDSPPLETLLQLELLEIINQPYRIAADDQHSASPSNIAGPDSPVWELHDWSLKLTRALIESGFLSIAMAKVVENHLANLVDTIRGHYPGRLTSQRSPTNFALLAHCLYKLVKIIGNSDVAQRRLLSASFICDHLFPLACEFAAIEYPATVVDPISHYESFESSGKLEDPDESPEDPDESPNAPGNQDGNNCSAPRDHDLHLLPPTHVCLEHLIFKLILSSNADTQNVVVEFLKQKILKDTNYYDDIDFRATAGKLALINKIVALTILGRAEEELERTEPVVFLNTLVLPTLHHDCLLMKICKFQLMNRVVINHELRFIFVRVYLCELTDTVDVESSKDQRHKLFIIFTKLASKFLAVSRDPSEPGYPVSLSSTCLTYMVPLEVKSKLNLVKKIAALYRCHKIIEPLALVDMLLGAYLDDPSLTKECERLMTRVIDSIADELLALLPNMKNDLKRTFQLSRHLFSSVKSRRQPLMDETIDKLMKVVKICLLDDESNKQMPVKYDPNMLNTLNLAYLTFALKFPLKKQTQAGALSLFDRVLEKFQPGMILDVKKLIFSSILLGNLAFYQVTNSSKLYTGNKGDAYDERNMLLESAHRMGKICAMCQSIPEPTSFVSSCIMSALMSWLSLSVEVGDKSPSTTKRHGAELDQIWQRFVKLIFTGFDKFDPKENDKLNARRKSFRSMDAIDRDSLALFNTHDNILFAIMAAFNYDSSFLESHLYISKGPATDSESHTKKYVKLWLDVITRPNDVLWLQLMEDDLHTARSQVYISCLTLINIHQARIDSKLTFSLKGLIGQLNAARLAILKCLSELNKKAILCDSPLKNFYADSIQQLEAIGQFK